MKVSPAYLSRSKKERYEFLGKEGRVVSFTSIAVAPDNLKSRTPYIIAVIDFGKKRATLPLTDVEVKDVELGMKVKGVMRRMQEPDTDGLILYGTKCVPISNK